MDFRDAGESFDGGGEAADAGIAVFLQRGEEFEALGEGFEAFVQVHGLLLLCPVWLRALDSSISPPGNALTSPFPITAYSVSVRRIRIAVSRSIR